MYNCYQLDVYNKALVTKLPAVRFNLFMPPTTCLLSRSVQPTDALVVMLPSGAVVVARWDSVNEDVK